MTTTLLNKTGKTEKIEKRTDSQIEASNLAKMAKMPKGVVANFIYDPSTGDIIEFTDVLALKEDDFCDACYLKVGDYITNLETYNRGDPSPRAMFNLKNAMKAWNKSRK